MQISDLDLFWLWNVYNDTFTPQPHHYTLFFEPPVTIMGQISLNIVSLGGDVGLKVGGVAAATLFEYTYIDSAGVEKDVSLLGKEPIGDLFEKNVTSVTWSLIVTKAWAGAHGTIFYSR